MQTPIIDKVVQFGSVIANVVRNANGVELGRLHFSQGFWYALRNGKVVAIREDEVTAARDLEVLL